MPLTLNALEEQLWLIELREVRGTSGRESKSLCNTHNKRQ